MTQNRGVYMPLYTYIDTPELALREQIHLSGQMQSELAQVMQIAKWLY